MAGTKSTSKEDYGKKIELANTVSIIDYAKQKGIEIIDEDMTTAMVTDPDSDHEIIIFKEGNSWRLDTETDMDNKNNPTYGNTIRFVARIEGIDWRDAVEMLVIDRGKYLSSEEYNNDFAQRMQEKERAEQKQVLEVAASSKTVAQDPDKENKNAQRQNVDGNEQQTQTVDPIIQTNDVPHANNQPPANNPFPGQQQPVNYGYRRTFNKEQMAEILAGIKKGVDISVYDKIFLRPEQMRQVRLALESNINPSAFNYPFISAAYMKEVRLAMQKKLDISLFSITENGCPFTANQAREIRKGLENGLNPDYVKEYAKAYLSADAMKEIRLGLQDGFEQMNKLCNGNYTAQDIHTIRITLTIKKLLESIATHMQNLYERIMNLFKRIIENNQYQTISETVSSLTPEQEALHELKSTVTEIYNNIEETIEDLPLKEKEEIISEVLEDVASKAETMEQYTDARPEEILDQAVSETVETKADEALRNQASTNMTQEYINDFHASEVSYNLQHVEFTTKVMMDQTLTQHQKAEIMNATLGSMYGEMAAHIWTNRFTKELQVMQEQIRNNMAVREEFRQEQMEETEMVLGER